MPSFQFAALSLASIVFSSDSSIITNDFDAIDTTNCEPIVNLGLGNLDRFDYSVDMDLNESCEYSVQVKFKHDPTLPDTNDPAIQCNPFSAPVIASDGFPYLADRWAYQTVPKYIKEATGIDHISIDFLPCGHPPLTAFGVPHYDFHVYRKDPEYRACMTCVTGMAPICLPMANQTTSNGRGFFNVNTVLDENGQPSNMPAGYTVDRDAMVPLMGGHAWDLADQPNFTAANPWVEPMWIMGPYDGGIVDYEPMFPLSYVTGNVTHNYEKNLEYVGQTISELPNMFSVAYDGNSKEITINFRGTPVGDCKDMSSKSAKSSKSAWSFKSSKSSKKGKKSKGKKSKSTKSGGR